MIVVLLAAIAGVIVAAALDVYLPEFIIPYTSVLIIVTIDSLSGAFKGIFKDDFRLSEFLTGYVLNGLLAVGLVFLGEKAGFSLLYPVAIVFILKIFNKFSGLKDFFLQKIYKN